MVRLQRWRAWKLLFAGVLSVVFGAFTVYWRQAFDPQDTKNHLSEVSSHGPAADRVESCGPCQIGDLGLEDSLWAKPQYELGLGEEPPSSHGRAAPGTRKGRPVKKAPPSGSRRSRLAAQRFKGPYSLAIRQEFREAFVPGQTFAIPPTPAPRESRSLGQTTPYDVLTFGLPTIGRMTSGYGYRKSPFHDEIVPHRGIDYAVRHGARIFASAAGRVVHSGWSSSLGRMVAIDHGGHIVTRYAHASRLLVKVGDQVERGQVVARAGNSGRSTGTHLHFELWVRGQPVDPKPYLHGTGGRPRSIKVATSGRLARRRGSMQVIK